LLNLFEPILKDVDVPFGSNLVNLIV